jgi:hypothetical protein
LSTALIFVLATMWMATAARAQGYGVDQSVIVPSAAPGSITIDGVYEADIWDSGATLNLLANTNFWSDDYPQPDEMFAEAKVLFSEDTLYVFVTIEEDELFFHDEGYGGDHILIGIDPVHEAGVTDQLVDDDPEEGYAGWPENAPDLGPYAYTVQAGDQAGLKLWWGFAGTDPVAEGWAHSEIWVDEDNTKWGVEAALYVPTVEAGAEIGFNIGGATGSQDGFDELESAYGYFSHWSVSEPGSDIQARTASYGTLTMAGGGEGYGSGVVVEVPRVDPGSIVIDGMADEPAWEDAQDAPYAMATWNAYGAVGDGLDEPDLDGETKLLWSEDTLYVSHRLFDPLLYFQEENPWDSDMIMLGLDNSGVTDDLFDPDYGGGAEFAPDSIYTYFINPIDGFTIAFNPDVSPADSGWVDAVVYQDEISGEWGFEAAIFLSNVEMGAQIGFDIGGTQATDEEAQCSEGECVYAYYAWQSGTGGDPGLINRSAEFWGALTMVEEITTAIEALDEVPDRITLKQNYPNPFNPSTTIEFALEQPAMVTLEVFNVLGRHVTTLVDEQRPTGTYRISWDAADLSSGVYVYQLRVDGEPAGTRKMMLIK